VPEDKQCAIFDEFLRSTRERELLEAWASLSIVQRLGRVLDIPLASAPRLARIGLLCRGPQGSFVAAKLSSLRWDLFRPVGKAPLSVFVYSRSTTNRRFSTA